MADAPRVRVPERKRREAEATGILKAAGFTPMGLPKGKTSGAQAAFERRIIVTPMGGMNRH